MDAVVGTWTLHPLASRNAVHARGHLFDAGHRTADLVAEDLWATGGKSISISGTSVFHFRGGKISEAWFFDVDPYTADPWYDAGLK